jgi:TonB family protein
MVANRGIRRDIFRPGRTLTSLFATTMAACLFAASAGMHVCAKPSARKPAAHTHASAACPARPVSATAIAPAGALNAAYTSWINRLRGKLDRNWYLADGTNLVTITATVSPDGSVSNFNVSSSPNNATAEQAAADAFNHAQPLEGLPSGSSDVKLTLTFKSFADPHGDNSRSITGQISAANVAASTSSSSSSTSTSSSSSTSTSSSESTSTTESGK